MKNEASGRSQNPKPKIFGAIPVQVSEEDAGRLVGGIVEKGFSDDQRSRTFGPPAPPRPTVLPFPVARHRSHGPHWAPKVESFNVVNGNGDMDEDVEEEYGDGMDLVAAVANPVQRKEKRDLDFSRWQEIVDNECSSLNHGKKKERHIATPEVGRKAGERTSDKSMQIAEPENTELCRDSLISSKEKQEDLKMHLEQKSDVGSSLAAQKLVGVEDGSLESQIDFENRARLANMSSDEIVEAQAEIMAKLNPGLISALKKRGQNKVRKQENSGFAAQKFVGGEDDSAESCIDSGNCARLAEMSAEAQAEVMTKLNPELINALKKPGQDKIRRQESSLSHKASSETHSMQHEKNTPHIMASPKTFVSDEPVKMFTGDATKEKNLSDTSPSNTSAWDAWSKRVERVRDMRFSLDGNIISSDLVRASITGIESSGGYNPNNVSERDFIRTEGDPGAAGYTIKETVALTRSVVPGQRALALHLIAAILNRAVCNICRNQVSSTLVDTDWEAIWAFALGPEPELALTLRMSLDDNHNSVVLACAKAIQSVLSYEMNETIFDILERTPISAVDICTAPVFRSKPDVNAGFLRGGFWKYNTKPSNILHFGEGSAGDKAEGEHTIQDDVVVAEQDVAAGLVRMGILPRICYLMETDPSVPLEECLISILTAISRHSPTCAAAVIDSGKIVETVASRFTSKGQLGISACKIKSVTLLKVLAQLEEKNCLAFIKHGILRQVTWQLFRHTISIDQWIKSGKEACKLSSALLVEQIRLWKVFIHYGYCISDFPDLYASLCIWLSVPDFQKLFDNDVMDEYCAIAKEVYLLLDALAGRLPNFYLHMHEKPDHATQDEQDWLWHQFGSIIDQALEWIVVKRIPHVSRLFDCQNKDGESRSWADSEIASVLWVISSVLNMLSSVLKALMPEDIMHFPNGHFPWLPDFVPKLGLEIIKNGYFRFSGGSGPTFDNDLSENTSVVKFLCDLRLRKEPELAISSSCCLQGVVQVVAWVEKLIQRTNLDIRNPQFKHQHLSREDKVLADGMLKSSVVEVRDMLTILGALITKEWQRLQLVEMFGRGGPAPGVGVGWGTSGGGYWSLDTLLAQQDSRLLVYLLEISEMPSAEDPLEPGQIDLPKQMLNAALSACLIVGPGNSPVIDKLLRFIFQVPVLKYLEVGIHEFLSNGMGYGSFSWKYTEEEFLLFANVLMAHFSNRWLRVKKKSEAMGEDNRLNQRYKKKESRTLETIHEDLDVPNTVGKETSFRVEWAHERLPLPVHWFLSPISTIENETSACIPGVSGKETWPSNFIDTLKAGLFFLLGVEAMPTFLNSPVKLVNTVWKLHAMSVSLLSGLNILHDGKSRDVFESLQNVYGATIDETGPSLQFESDIHENYSTFIEILVEQFAAESYGDELFGRQVAIYLHRSVEASVRLTTWNALSNARVLELLPSLPKCLMKAEGYLEPIEDNERILESYVKSWVSGALDKAATRGSMAFSLALHNLSSFIFGSITDNMLPLHNRLVKSLLRDYYRKEQHEGMMVKLICYQKPAGMMSVQAREPIYEIEKRLQILKNVGDGISISMEKLENRIKREVIVT